MPLTDTACKNAKANPNGKPIKLTDEKGMHLLVNGVGKYWRLSYRFDGKQKTLALGTYPEISLKDARNRRDDARRLLADGIDPGVHKKVQKAVKILQAENRFEVIAREWFAKYLPTWTAGHADKIMRRFERDIFPWIGKLPITQIDTQELLAALRRIEHRGAIETAHRALQSCGQVFRYAVASGRAQRNPAADLAGALAPTISMDCPGCSRQTPASRRGPLKGLGTDAA